MNIENKYRDVTKESGSSWTGNKYEITFRIDRDSRKSRKVLLSACSVSESLEIFRSLPQLKGHKVQVVETKGVVGEAYFL